MEKGDKPKVENLPLVFALPDLKKKSRKKKENGAPPEEPGIYRPCQGRGWGDSKRASALAELLPDCWRGRGSSAVLFGRLLTGVPSCSSNPSGGRGPFAVGSHDCPARKRRSPSRPARSQRASPGSCRAKKNGMFAWIVPEAVRATGAARAHREQSGKADLPTRGPEPRTGAARGGDDPTEGPDQVRRSGGQLSTNLGGP